MDEETSSSTSGDSVENQGLPDSRSKKSKLATYRRNMEEYALYRATHPWHIFFKHFRQKVSRRLVSEIDF